MSVRLIEKLAEIVSSYTVLFVDQWGVMHNGHVAFPWALDCLSECYRQGFRIITISNSSRRRDESLQNLHRLGFDEGRHFHDLVTSGETVFGCLDHYKACFGNRVWSLNWTLGDSLLDDEHWVIEQNIDKADWILCSGVPHGHKVESFYPDLLRGCERGLPLVCSNPDVLTVGFDKLLTACPGVFAEFYESKGGFVHWHGKPKPEIYRAALSMCGIEDIPRDKILGIGDSLLHDIAGITNFGGHGCLIGDGIHRDNLVASSDSVREVRDLCVGYDTPMPHYLLNRLS